MNSCNNCWYRHRGLGRRHVMRCGLAPRQYPDTINPNHKACGKWRWEMDFPKPHNPYAQYQEQYRKENQP